MMNLDSTNYQQMKLSGHSRIVKRQTIEVYIMADQIEEGVNEVEILLYPENGRSRSVKFRAVEFERH